MKTILTTIIIVVLLSLVPGSATAATEPFPLMQPQLEGEDLEFGLVNEQTLWLRSGSQLYKSADEGQSWVDISPSTEMTNPYLVVSFPGPELGYALLITQTAIALELELHKTSNQGIIWDVVEANLENKLNQEFSQPFSSFQMQWLNDNLGWIMVRETTGSNFSIGTLYQTDDGGHLWKAIEVPVAEEFVFLNEGLGFMLNPADSQTLYRTTDSGLNWAVYGVEIPPELIANQFTVDLPMATDEEQYFFPVTIHSEEDSDFQVLVDINTTLNAKSPLDLESLGVIPLILPASAKTGPLGTQKQISEVHTRNAQNLWVEVSGGACENILTEDGSLMIECESTWQVLKSDNSGLTWEEVSLPGGIKQVSQRFNNQEQSIESSLEPKSPGIQAGMWVQNYTGHAFDKCEIPTLSQLQTWYNHSPYRAVNLYIGGISRFCTNAPLTASYIQSIYRQGWKLIPTWVGHQAPCTNFKYPFPYNVAQAYQYGVNNANQANARMKDLNLSNPDGSGSIVYLDLEHFGYTPSCSAAARAYLEGWTARMTQLGITTGLYSTTSTITNNQFFNVGNQFEAVWAAEWYQNPGFRPNQTVWNLRYLSNIHWPNYQRIVQYSGGHTQTWGGLSMDIDSNVAEGKVAVPYGADLTPPVTTATLHGTFGQGDWYNVPVRITLTATDNSVGVRHTYYKIGDGVWHLYTAPFLVSGGSMMTVRYMSVDKVDNWEAPKIVTFKVDTVPPVLSRLNKVGCRAHDAIPQRWCNNAYFAWDPAVDTGVGVPTTQAYQYYWGTNRQGTSANYTHGVWFDPDPIPMQTPHYFRLRVRDNHGNWSAWKTMFTLIYDPFAKDPIWLPILHK